RAREARPFLPDRSARTCQRRKSCCQAALEFDRGHHVVARHSEPVCDRVGLPAVRAERAKENAGRNSHGFDNRLPKADCGIYHDSWCDSPAAGHRRRRVIIKASQERLNNCWKDLLLRQNVGNLDSSQFVKSVGKDTSAAGVEFAAAEWVTDFEF